MNNPKPIVVANLKANLTWEEVSTWLDKVGQVSKDFKGTIIFCPSYQFLTSVKEKIDRDSINIKLGSQNISKFEQGAYTGEVAASQIADLVQFAIIGHSERRQNFKEDQKILEAKVKNAQNAKIEPIFCVQDENTSIPKSLSIIAYEPVFAIGTNNPDSPENVQDFGKRLKANGTYTILYGGSVSAGNVKTYVKEHIHGVLVGATNSLDPQKFIGIISSLN